MKIKMGVNLLIFFALFSCRGSLTQGERDAVTKYCRSGGCTLNDEGPPAPEGKEPSITKVTDVTPVPASSDDTDGLEMGGDMDGEDLGFGGQGGDSQGDGIVSNSQPQDHGNGSDPFSGLGDFFSDLGKGVSKAWNGAWNELNGDNAKARRRAREGKKLVSEAKDFWKKAELLKENIKQNTEGLEKSWSDIRSLAAESQLSNRKNDLKEIRDRYNKRTGEILEQVPLANPAIFEESEEGPGDKIYPEHHRVEQGRNYLTYAKQKVEAQSHSSNFKARESLVGFGNAALDAAEGSFRAGHIQEGGALVDMGIAAADLALSLTPGVGWAKDGYEAISGSSILDGHQLTSAERTIAMVGLLTGGIGSKLAIMGKGAKVVDVLTQSAKNADEAESIARAGNRALETLDSAKKFEVPPTKLGEYVGRLREAGRTKGNFDLPKGTKNEANFLGESWVGPNAKQVPYQGQPGQFIYISQDGLKQFRPPVVKPDGRTLANFQWKDPVTGSWFGNGHMEVID